MTTGDVATDALRSAMVGDVADAFRILTEHVRQADDPRQAMFVLAAGYASVAHDDELLMVTGMPADDADVLRTLVAATRADDMVGAWLLWRTVPPGSAGAVLGGLLAVAALSAKRETEL